MNRSARSFDVVVVGAGPGGIAAAVTAAEAGRSVALIDEAPFAGGQIWRNTGKLPKSKNAVEWFTRLEAQASIVRIQQARVCANPSADELLVEGRDGVEIVKWSSLILATGAREFFLPFPGWTLPGVMGAGALQSFVKSGLPVKGKRIVLAGTGPLLLAVAELLIEEGADVSLILEQAGSVQLSQFGFSLLTRPGKLLQGLALRARVGKRYSANSFIRSIEAKGDALRVQINQKGEERSIECDFVGCGFNLIPNNELAQLLGCRLGSDGFVQVEPVRQTNLRNVYAVGELTGIGGAEKAILEGRIAALSASGRKAEASRLYPLLERELKFVQSLRETFQLRSELTKLASAQTILCRCEDVRKCDIESAISSRDAKLQTRCGMGPCQGRICGPILQKVLGTEPPRVRAPIYPTSIAALATANESE